MDYDIVVVGGGIAGLNFCYQILKKHNNYKILLIEKNNRLGGRVLTSKIGDDKFDVGAGRLAGHHKYTVKLLKELQLWNDRIDIKSGYKVVLKTLTSEEIKINKKYPNFESIFNLLLKKLNKNIKLENYTVLQLIKKCLGKHHASYAQKVFEYDSELSFMNAKEAVQSLKKDFTGDKKYYIIKDRNSSIIEKLIDKIKNKVELKLNSELVDIKKNESGFSLKINEDCVHKNLHAQKVIFALDKKGLDNIEYLYKYSKLFSYTQSRPLYRVYAKYSKNRDNKIWFEELSKIITDLPIKFIIPVDSKSGIIMITYTDGQYTEYWKKQFNKNQFINSLNKDLKILFPKTEFSEIKWLSHYYWDAGAHYWIPGTDVDTIIDQIRNPDKDIYIVGEAVSKHQAWIEGALYNEDIIEKIDKLY